MRYFRYVEPNLEGDPTSLIISEEDILKEYLAYWTRRMKDVGKESEISPENCIEDWVANNWAWEVNEQY